MRKRKTKDKKIRNILLNQKGMALLTTLIFVFLLVTFGVSLLVMTSNDIKLSTLQRDSTKAFYIAEAGIEKALWLLNIANTIRLLEEGSITDPDIPEVVIEKALELLNIANSSRLLDEDFGEGSYKVTVVKDSLESLIPVEPPILLAVGDKFKITSTGVVEGGTFSPGKRKIEVVAEVVAIATLVEPVEYEKISWREVY